MKTIKQMYPAHVMMNKCLQKLSEFEEIQEPADCHDIEDYDRQMERIGQIHTLAKELVAAADELYGDMEAGRADYIQAEVERRTDPEDLYMTRGNQNP